MAKLSKKMQAEIFLEDTGERMIPKHHKGRNIYGSHIGRYAVALPLVKGKIVLDIASGSGYGTKLIAEHAKSVYGVDINQESVDYAKKHYNSKNITYKKGDGESIPLDDDSVDIVVSYETIEHIKNYEGFLSEVKRVLKPNGLLLLSTPNGDEYVKGNPFHIDEFTYGDLKKLTKKYFKHHKDYFQTQWLSSTILPTDLQSSEWETSINTINTCKLSPEKCLYLFMICSNREIKEEIKPISVLGEHFRQHDVHAKLRVVAEREQELTNQIDQQKSQTDLYKKAYEEQVKKYEVLANSHSIKMTKPLRLLKSAAKDPKKAINRLRNRK